MGVPMLKIETALLLKSIHENDLAITKHRAASLRKEALKLDLRAERIEYAIIEADKILNSTLFDIMLHVTTRKFLWILKRYEIN